MSAVLGLVDVFEVANRMVGPTVTIKISHEILRETPSGNGPHYDALVLPPNLNGARGQGTRRCTAGLRNSINGVRLCARPARGRFGLGMRVYWTVQRPPPIGR